jgi:hypothetical protein
MLLLLWPKNWCAIFNTFAAHQFRCMTQPLYLSTAWFPPVLWFAALQPYRQVCIEAHETYAKQSYRNRCYVAGPNGVQALVVPVIKPEGNRSKIREALLADQAGWRITHWRSIEAAYNKSPFFIYYRDGIKSALFENITRLFDLNLSLIMHLLSLLGLAVEIKLTDEFQKQIPGSLDLRYQLHPKKQPEFPVNLPVYTQVFEEKHGFVPNLSILDLLFNEGPAAGIYLKELRESLQFVFLPNNLNPAYGS